MRLRLAILNGAVAVEDVLEGVGRRLEVTMNPGRKWNYVCQEGMFFAVFCPKSGFC